MDIDIYGGTGSHRTGKQGAAMGKTIYVALTDTGTVLSKMIGMYTGKV